LMCQNFGFYRLFSKFSILTQKSYKNKLNKFSTVNGSVLTVPNQ
jgi:hypothetical protein